MPLHLHVKALSLYVKNKNAEGLNSSTFALLVPMCRYGGYKVSVIGGNKGGRIKQRRFAIKEKYILNVQCSRY